MSDLSKYQQEQVKLTRKIIFEKDKEALRKIAHSLLKNNNDIVMKNVTMSVEYEKLLHIAQTQATLIEKMKEDK